MTPGTDPHANITIRTHLAPVIKTGLGIQLPPQRAIDFFLILQWNGVGRAAVRTFFANPAKIYSADINGFVRDQRQIRGDRSQADPRTIVFGH